MPVWGQRRKPFVAADLVEWTADIPIAEDDPYRYYHW